MQMSVQCCLTSLLAMLIVIVAAGCGLLATETGNWEKTVQAATVPSAASTSNARDFDFLVGSWEVSNRRLKVRNVGSTDWDEFPGYQVMRTVLGGIGNVDEIEFPSKGWSGMTLRLFNPQTRQWTIYWVNSRDGIMQAPVVGTFNRGVGEFFGEDIDHGKPVRVRYIWSNVTENAARWEQAFSLNGCKTWETNWIMELRRSGPSAIETTPGRIQETVSLDHPRGCCPVVELRQYTLYSGKRDTLIEVFDREFVESQEQLGMRGIGQFRDMDKPNRFVWLRGFGDFSVRANELQAFMVDRCGPRTGPWRTRPCSMRRTYCSCGRLALSAGSRSKVASVLPWRDRTLQRDGRRHNLLFRRAGETGFHRILRAYDHARDVEGWSASRHLFRDRIPRERISGPPGARG